MRTGDIDRSKAVWVYTPRHHKTAHHGIAREIRIGARAQQILSPFLRLDPDAFLFSPTAAEADRHAGQRENRETPVQPSQVKRQRQAKRQRRRRAPGDRYDVASYRRAIARACDRAFPPPAELARQEDETPATWKARLTAEQRAALSMWREQHRWHPHQLRHNAATRLRREFGIDAARIILGHRSAAVTETYAEIDATRADEIMAKVG
jgi:integrase